MHKLVPNMQNTILRFCRIPTGSILTQLHVPTSIHSTLYENSLEFIAVLQIIFL